MGIYGDTPTIDAIKVKIADGTWITRVTKNGKVIRETPLPDDQIPKDRKSMLWTTDDLEVKDLSFTKNSRKM